MNPTLVHTPERLPHETQADYRERQAASKRATDAMTMADWHKQHGKPSSREKLRDEQRANGSLRGGIYGAAVVQPLRRKDQQRMEKMHPRDANGAVTLTGSRIEFIDVDPGQRYFELGGYSGPDGFAKDVRRIWLAGVSAQRGY